MFVFQQMALKSNDPFHEGSRLFTDGKYPEAIAEYTKSLSIPAYKDAAYLNIGIANFMLKEYDAAREALGNADASKFDAATAVIYHHYSARVCKQLKDYGATAKHFEAAISIFDQNKGLVVNESDGNFGKEDFELFLKNAQKLAQLFPKKSNE